MNIIEARKWAFEQLEHDAFESVSKRLARAEALAQWLLNGDYEPPPELPIGDKGLS